MLIYIVHPQEPRSSSSYTSFAPVPALAMGEQKSGMYWIYLGYIGVTYTSASVKSYQLVKVVSGGRAPEKKFKFGITTTFGN